MDKKDLSKTVHSESCERDPLRGRKPREVLVDLPTLEAMLKK